MRALKAPVLFVLLLAAFAAFELLRPYVHGFE